MPIDPLDRGGYLPDHPYFPLMLGNGVDCTLINLMGSGEAWWEACTRYSAPLQLQAVTGWFKSDRRTRRGTDLIYGSMIPLFEFASVPMIGPDQVVPRNSRQWFNPRTATLTTEYEQIDSRSGQWLRVRVTSFLCDDHTLVERIEILDAPPQGCSIGFHLNSPSDAYLRLYDPAITHDRVNLIAESARSLLRYDFTHESLQGGAVSWFDAPAQNPRTQTLRDGRFVHGSMQTQTLQQGAVVTRYLIAVDNLDHADHAAELEKILADCQRRTYDQRRADHVRRWRDYFETSHIELPDPSLAFVYDVSRYVLRANLHPSGYLPMGNLPYLWQGVMFWDTGFAVHAMLSSGNHEPARRILDHLQTYQSQAGALAQKYDSPGARIEWTVESQQMTPYPMLVEQVHNNAWWVHVIFTCYQHTLDRDFLSRQIDWMEQLLVYLVERWLENRGDHLVIKPCEGVDESIEDVKSNDTWTCAVVLRALIDFREALRVLDRASGIENLDRIIDGLRAGLDQNIDAQGVMQSFYQGSLPHWGSLIFALFPEHPALKPTLTRMMDNHDPATGWTNMHGVTRYAEKAFPWADCWAARILGSASDARAHPLLQQAMKSANGFGGLPERIFYHHERFNPWFMTGHAALVWAVNGVLAQTVGDELRLLGGVHETWRDVAFTDLCTEAGLRVSATVRAGDVTLLSIENLHPDHRDVEILLGQKSLGRYKLEAGINVVVSSHEQGPKD